MPNRDHMRVLIVDDELGDRESLARCIHRTYEKTELKIDVSHAATLDEMYDKLGRTQIDLVFLDINFKDNPDGGLAELRRLHDTFPRLPTIIVTGYFIDRIKKAIDHIADGRICEILDKSEYGTDEVYMAVEKARQWSPDFNNKHDTGAPVETEAGIRRCIDRTLSALTPRIRYSESALDDLGQCAEADSASYAVVVRELVALQSCTNTSMESKVIHGCNTPVRERYAGDDFRLYFEPGEQLKILRVGHKNRQRAILGWLKSQP